MTAPVDYALSNRKLTIQLGYQDALLPILTFHPRVEVQQFGQDKLLLVMPDDLPALVYLVEVPGSILAAAAVAYNFGSASEPALVLASSFAVAAVFVAAVVD